MTTTAQRLAEALKAAGLEELGERAKKGEFSDFESPHAMPKVELVQELNQAMEARAVGMDSPINLLKRAVLNGDYDDSNEEAAAWWAREGAGLMFKKKGGIR